MPRRRRRALVQAVFTSTGTFAYRLYLGIADGMSIARAWARRYSKRRGGHFGVPARPHPGKGHVVGDADMPMILMAYNSYGL